MKNLASNHNRKQKAPLSNFFKFFNQRIYVYKWELNIFGLICIFCGLIAGGVFTSLKVWESIKASGELNQAWSFANAGDYSLSDSSLVEVVNNSARLKVRNYANDVNTKLLLHFDESSGNPVDSSGTPNTVTANNVTYAAGNLNNSATLNGSTSQISAANSSALQLTGNNTLEAWIKLNANFTATSSNRQYGIYDKGDYKLYYDNNTGKVTYELADSAATNWTQVAGNDINRGWDLNGKFSVECSVVLDTELYVGTGNQLGDAEVWVYNSSSAVWSQIGGDGLNGSWSNALYEQVLSIASDGTNIYAGLGNTAGDAEVWRYNGTTWSKIGGDGVGSSWSAASNIEGVYALAYVGTFLYAGTGNTAGDGDLWRYNTGTSTWSQIGGDNVNSSWPQAQGSMEYVHALTTDGTNLYVGLGNTSSATANQDDAEVWIWNGSAWTKLAGDAAGGWNDAANIESVLSLYYMGSNLYAGTGTTAGDGDLWRWNGSTWTQIGGDGLNSSWAASAYEGVYSITGDGTNIYVGLGATANTDAEVWRWSGSAWAKLAGDDAVNNFSISASYNAVNALSYYNSTVFAGISSSAATAQVWSYSGSGVAWSLEAGNGVKKSWGYFNLQSVESMAVAGDYLYAGTGNTVAGNAIVWRYDGSTWSIIGGQGVNTSWASNTYEIVSSLGTYNGQLYAGLGSTDNDAEVWRFDGSSWTKVGGDNVNSGWGTVASLHNNVYSFAVYGNNLFAALGGNLANEAEVWSYNGSTWAKVGGDGVNNSWNTSYEIVYSLSVYNGNLYAGLGLTATDAEVWSYNGSTWAKVGGDGVNNSWNTVYEAVETLKTFNNKLYAGLGNSSDDAEVWEYNGSTWSLIGGDSVNNSWAAGEMERVRSLAGYNGELYASTGTAAGDAEVWRYNGTTWTRAGGDDANNSWTINQYENAGILIDYKGKIYAGLGDTANTDASIWSFGNNAVLSSTTSSFDTEWRHIAATYNGTAMKIFINGVEDASTNISRTIPTSTKSLLIGSSYNGNNAGRDVGLFQGELDEMRISNTARSTFVTSPFSNAAQTVSATANVFTSGILAWDSFAHLVTLNGGTVNYRISDDNGASWKYWDSSVWAVSSSLTQANAEGTISTNLETFPVTENGFRWQAVLQGSGTQQVTLNTLSLLASEDINAPSAPNVVVALDTTNGATTLTNNEWNRYSAPQFTFSGASDAGSGLEGYWVYFGTDNTAEPSTAGVFQVGNTYVPSGMTSNATYYLRIRARDNAQNLSTTFAAFTYKYDATSPANPNSLTALPPGYTATNSYTFIWTGDASDTAGSGVVGYQYSINNSTSWGATIPTATTQVSLSNIANEGVNTLYLRTLDAAGNTSISFRTVNFYFAGTAPGVPQNLNVAPSTNIANNFAFSWSAPETYAGYPDASGLTYCYTINTLPSASTCTFTSAAATGLAAAPFANQPGSNTFYIAAKDAVNNINYNAYSSITFTANTSSPGIPVNLEIADVSVKTSSSWKVALSWEAPTSGNINNLVYDVYRSTNANSYVFAARVSGIAHIDTGLEQLTYYYKVRACDNTNNCGVFSSNVSILPDGRFTDPAALFAEPEVTGITTKKTTINWVTDRNSDSKVAFGLASNTYLPDEPSNSTPKTNHSIALTNLLPNTRYYFVTKWTDEDGNTGTSTEGSFMTLPAPSLTEPLVTAVNLTTANIKYTVNGASRVRIYYGESSNFGAIAESATATIESSYTNVLDNLREGTKYFYKINTFDTEGAEYEGSTLSFQTVARPKITNVRFQQVLGTAQPAVLVTWDTNTETSSIITYSGGGESKDEVNVTYTKAHRIILRGLNPNSIYNLIPRSRDKLGNETKGDTQTFTTASDTRVPVIIDVIVEAVDVANADGSGTTSQLIITWNTDEESSSQVEYGEGTGTTYSQKSQEDATFTTNHSVVIANLQPAKVYHLRVISKDRAGNESKSADVVTITPKATDNAFDLVISNLSQIFSFLRR